MSPNTKSKFKIYLALIMLMIVLLVGEIYFLSKNNSKKVIAENQISDSVNLQENINKEEEEVKDYVTLTFAGDVMFDRGVKSSVNKNFNGDYYKLFENITSKEGGVNIFKNDDISFVNLEGPVSEMGHKVGSIYSFRMPTETISVLKDLGIDIVSFANNHVGDYTKTAFKDTLDRLKTGEISWTGAGYNYDEAKTVSTITVNDIKVGYIGFSDVGPEWMKATKESSGILLANDKNFDEIIKNAKEECDVLVVSFHWGEEYKPYNDRQKYLAEKAIDDGADIIVGHHPHVPQAIVYYKEKPIIYSLGNFMFDQYFSTETMSGLVVQIEVKKNGYIQKLTEYISNQNKKFDIGSIVKKDS